jgi:transcriptional regulator with XRE-family HTH domain
MFGERLKALRLQSELSQGKLARLADVGVMTVSNLENGKIADPNWSTVVKLARALGVSVAEFDVEDGPAPEKKESEAKAKKGGGK